MDIPISPTLLQALTSVRDGGAAAIITAHSAKALLREKLMDPVHFLIWVAIGAVAGWLAGQVIKGGAVD